VKNLFKKAYKHLPFKKQLFSFIKLFGIPPENICKHLTFHGVFTVKVDAKNSFRIYHFGQIIENELFWKGLYGGWEKKSMQVWTHLCRRARVIFDVGANTGIYSLVAKSINPAAAVYAFEPVHRVYERLKNNMRLNTYDVVCIEKAASDYDGTAKIFDTHEEHILSVTVNKNLSGRGEDLNEEIETVRMSTFIQQRVISGIDLMKIDVETHEPQVLDGMGDYLRQFTPSLLIEILTEEVAEKVNAKLAGLGYHFFYIDDDTNQIIKTDIISKRKCFNYLVCTDPVAAGIIVDL